MTTIPTTVTDAGTGASKYITPGRERLWSHAFCSVFQLNCDTLCCTLITHREITLTALDIITSSNCPSSTHAQQPLTMSAAFCHIVIIQQLSCGDASIQCPQSTTRPWRRLPLKTDMATATRRNQGVMNMRGYIEWIN